MNENEKLLKKISELESLNDQLLAELRYLDSLLKKTGFVEGLKTLKVAALEMIDQDKNKSWRSCKDKDSICPSKSRI